MNDDFESTDTAKEAHMTKMLAVEIALSAQILLAVVQPSNFELESPPPKHFLGQNEYAFLETDAQLRVICKMHQEVVDTSWELGGDRSRWKSPFRDTHPWPLRVVYFSDVKSRWSFKALRDAL